MKLTVPFKTSVRALPEELGINITDIYMGDKLLRRNMIIDELDLAKIIAQLAHAGQVDKLKRPYIGHLSRVAGRCKSYESQVVAWLHDILEDPKITKEVLQTLFAPSTVEAVVILTKTYEEEGSLEGYREYIDRICHSHNRIAMVVKANDIEDHLEDTTCLSREQIEKYEFARGCIYRDMLGMMCQPMGKA